MKKYKCIIVEDEPIAVEVLEDYIGQVPFLDLRGSCTDAFYALDFLRREPVDLMFLDIHLPRLKGLDFLRSLKNPPSIIITSAYGEYALQGYELNVIDYLLKPIEFSRFLTAVNKLNQPLLPRTETGQSASVSDRPHLFFNVNKRQVKIYLDEILVIESLREYVKISTTGKTILTKLQIGEVEEMLPPERFLRIHRSFIVSKTRVEAFSPSEVEVQGKPVPIGRNYKDAVLLSLQS